MQALFSGTHSAKLDMDMRKLEIELFDLLDKLYQEKRLKEYMKYESEVTRQMIIYNMLKKLFGYDDSDNEKVTWVDRHWGCITQEAKAIKLWSMQVPEDVERDSSSSTDD